MMLFAKNSCEEDGNYVSGAVKTMVLDVTELTSALTK